MIVVTGATGKLGRLVIGELLKTVPATEIAVAVRSPEKATELKALGVEVREADYSRPETLRTALVGAEKVLLISSTEMGPARVKQHVAVVDAAKTAGARLLAYTSVLGADTATLPMAADHKATEVAIRASGVPYVFLRNGWYFENYTANLQPALEHGAMLGASGEGRFSFAARADYAVAAAAVLTGKGFEDKTFELAGDSSHTLGELAAEVAKQAGKTVVYTDMPVTAYAGALESLGLPKPVAEMLANADESAKAGELESESRDLHGLIGRATMTMVEAVRAALKQH